MSVIVSWLCAFSGRKLKRLAVLPLLWVSVNLYAQVGGATAKALEKLADSVLAVTEFSQVALSPDGAQVGWVQNLPGASTGTAIYVSPIDAPVPRRIQVSPGKDASEGNIAWSPDSKRLAFLSDAERKGQRQLYLVDANPAMPRRLTNLTGYLDHPQWSPDGKSLAILFTANAPRSAGPLQPMTPDAGIVEEHFYEQRIAVVDAASGVEREVSPPDLYVYEYDWSPDGKSFAASAAHGSGDNNWWIAQLYTIATDSGATKAILKPELQIAAPRWSPDGSRIAYIGGLMSDEGSTGGDVFMVGREGGQARNLTAEQKASATDLTWLSASRLQVVENVAGDTQTVIIVLPKSQEKPDPAIPERLLTEWRGAESVSAGHGLSVSLSKNGSTWAAIRSSSEKPPEVWVRKAGDWKQITHSNNPPAALRGKAENISWRSDGADVQGWLFYPADYDPAKKYPMVVAVHGGPSAACLNVWQRSMTALLPSQGYFVFCPNPRGSYGQGETFTRGNVKDFGYGDLRDIMAGVDAVKAKLPIDEKRLGIAGWSYGGYMTMWAVTQTQRFAAAVAGAGLSNWQSYYGENDIDQWMIPFFGSSVYDDPQVYARSSPMTFIKNVKTPTLLLVGDRDGEVPAPQSYEFWHALKTLQVPTQLVVYPNEGHKIAQPEHQRDRLMRVLAWFNHYLAGVVPSAASH